MRKVLLLIIFAGLFHPVMSQSFTFHCTRDTAIACSLNCFSLIAQIPDLHGLTTDYVINPLSTTNGCYNPQVNPNIIGSTILLPIDDRYTSPINIGFSFPFYGQTYTQILASTNGYTCFDLTRAGLFSHYQIYQNFGALAVTGTPLDLPSPLYDKGLIMGPYHDLDPQYTTSPSMYIKYDTIGVAPYRKWVLSFYKVPLFDCQNSFDNTSQIALYESTGIVEIFVAEQQICPIWQNGRQMIGMQDFARAAAIMAPGRRASDPAWGTVPMNESWRFVPSAGPSLFKRVELYSLSGTLLSTGDTVGIGNGTLKTTFLNVCPAIGGNTSLIVKSFYKKIDDSTVEIVGTDTINVIRNAGVINATATPASCATGQGTITVITPTGANYEYSLDGGPWQSSPVFNNVPTGIHVVTARIIGSNCSSSKNVTISPLNTLTATYSTVDAACNGSASGSIIVTASLGTPPYTFSLDGAPFQVSDTFVNVPAGNHTIIVKDAGQCTFTLNNVFVANGSGIIASATETNVTCPGANNGTITVTPLNGQAPFTYSLNGGPFVTTNTFTGLAAGNYSIIVKDNTGCTATVNKTVGTDAGGFTATATSTNSGCTPSGTITVTPTPPATGPFTYSLDGGPAQVSNIFTGVAGGTHTVMVTQGGVCSFSLTVVVGTNASLTAIADSTNAECSGAFTGTINVTASNGVPPYQYKIDGGAFQLSGLFTGLGVGNHTITVKDNSGCIFSFIKGVAAGNGITATATSTNSACGSASTGTITVTGNGIAPYQYKIDVGIFQVSNFFSGLSVGNHTITVKDSAGCIFTFIQAVGASAGVTGTATSTNTACTGVSTGTITVTAANGISPYTYKIDAGIYQASNIFSGLSGGSHSITIKDSAGCTITFNQSVGTDVGVTATATSVNTSCNGVSNGTITINANGVPPYTYNIDGGAFQLSNLFIGLASGSHTIIVHDAAGCSFTFTQNVGADAGVTATATSSNTACAAASNSTITINPSAGISPYTYKIDGGGFQNSNIFTGLATGIHTIIVKDAAGCTFTFSQTINANSGVTATPTIGNAGCPGSNTGVIQLLAIDGISPYTFSLNGGLFQASNTFSNLAAGLYAIVVKDSAGCTFSLPVIVGTNPLVTANLTVVQPACNGTASGSITVNASLGTFPYQYALNAGAFQVNNSFNNLVAGNYTVHVKDATNCTFDTLLVLNQPSLLQVSATSSPATCNGNDGLLSILAAGGTAPIRYSVDGGITYGTSASLVDSIGSYNIRIKDANGCIADTFATIALNDTMRLTLPSDTTVCSGSSVAFTPATNSQTNIFNWTPTGGILNPSTGAYTVSPLDTTIYTLQAKWGVCQRTVTGTVNVLQKPLVNAGSDTIICDKTFAVLRGIVSNISGPVTYMWSPAVDILSPDTSNTPITRVYPKSYGQHVYTLEVDDNYGCNFKVTDKVAVIMNPPVPAFAGRDTIAAMDLPHQLFGSGGVNYFWSPPFLLDDPTKKNPIATLHGDTRFVLTVIDNGGCVGTDTVFVKVYKGPTYYIPNAFTPNGDGINDVFRAIPPGISTTEYFRIFNRWGQMIFETHDYLKGWNGTYIGKPQPAGAYVWIIKGVDKYGKPVEMKGTVMLIR